jgi:hypothetical protein
MSKQSEDSTRRAINQPTCTVKPPACPQINLVQSAVIQPNQTFSSLLLQHVATLGHKPSAASPVTNCMRPTGAHIAAQIWMGCRYMG